MLRVVWQFINYWYFRYLMVTELYMVERWERNFINASAITLFCLLWYFNVNYLVTGMSNALNFITANEENNELGSSLHSSYKKLSLP